jgi:hypothetical protein
MSSREWTRLQGYGNVDFATYNNQKVEKKMHPWNRLERMEQPFFTSGDVNMAWTRDYSSQMSTLMHNSCRKVDIGKKEPCSDNDEKNAVEIALTATQN